MTMSNQKFAPLQVAPLRTPDGKRYQIPWWIHLKAWEQYARLGHGDQSAERVAERGGFGLEEILIMLAGGNPWRTRDEDLPALTNDGAK